MKKIVIMVLASVMCACSMWRVPMQTSFAIEPESKPAEVDVISMEEETEPTVSPTEIPTPAPTPAPTAPRPTAPNIPVIPQHTHHWEYINVDATCINNGIHREVCSCGAVQEENIPALGHDYHESGYKAPEVNVEGYREYSCSRCDSVYYDTIPALQHKHDILTEDVSVSCTTDGKHVVKCVDCGEVLEETTTPALGHSYDLVESLPAAPGVDGYEKYQCYRCGDSYTNVLSALPVPEEHHHNPVACDIGATCTDCGQHIVKCADCGEVLEETTISATGHAWYESSRVDAAPGVEGFIEYTCANCGATRSDRIPALEIPIETSPENFDC